MVDYPDIMVDLETTGVDSSKSAIIQIAAVRFNLKERKVDPEVFDACLWVPDSRHWDNSTLQWWQKHAEVLERILSRMEEPREVLGRFQKWVCDKKGNNEATLWAKPSHFEYPFIESYFKEFKMLNPFHYRLCNDLNSFARGKYFPQSPPDFEKEIEFEGPSHDAIYDVFHQLKVLFAVADGGF